MKRSEKNLIGILMILFFSLIFFIIFYFYFSLDLDSSSLEVITKQSYPVKGEIWETQFKTNNKNDLIIEAINHTRWSFNNDSYDILFNSLYCGDEVVDVNFDDEKLIVFNYSCDNISYLRKEVITTGKHYFNISFGDSSGISQNLASIVRVYNMSTRVLYGHTAYEKGGNAPANQHNYDGGANVGDYTNLALSDNSRWNTSLASSDGDYDSQIYHFNITEDLSTISQFVPLWEGQSSEVRSSYNLSFFIRNLNTGTWEQIATDADGSTTDVSWSSVYNTNIQNYINTSGGDKKIYLYSRFKHYVASLSCPFVYSYDGEQYFLEHESFPFSVIESAKSQTNDRLQRLKEVDGEYIIKIKEELHENSFIDKFDLFVVDHEGGGFVMPDVDGGMHTIENLVSPISCVDEENNSCIYAVSRFDNVFYRDNFNRVVGSNRSTYKDITYVEFDSSLMNLNGSNSAKLFLKIQKQEIMTKVWSFYLDSIGENYWSFFQDLISKTFLSEFYNDAFKKVINLKIEVFDEVEGKWREVGSIKAGRHTLDDFLIYFNTSGFVSEEIEFRFTSIKGFYEIDYMAIDYSLDQDMEILPIYPKEAILNGDDDVIFDLSKEDDIYVSLFQWDEIDLKYDAIDENSNNWTRDYSISISGYYNFIDFRKRSFFEFVKGIVPWLDSLFFPEDIPELLYDNIKDRDSRKHNTLLTDYVEVKVSSQEGLTWNDSGCSFLNVSTGIKVSKSFEFNATNFNSNILITSSGNGTGFISVSQTSFSDMVHAQTNQVEINCSPLSSQAPGLYQAIFNVHSNQHLVGDNLIINCQVIDIENPKVTNINPVAGVTFVEPITISINATVVDNVAVDTVYAQIEHGSNTDILTLTDLDNDDVFTGTYIVPVYYGRYNITIFANDTSNNINDSEVSYFNVRLEYSPNITTISPNSTFGVSYVAQNQIDIAIDEPNSQSFDIVYTAESTVTIKWYLDGIELNSNENSTNYLWIGNYVQEGVYLILVNVSNGAGYDYKFWNMTVNNVTKPELFVYSPQNITYTTDNILINFSSTYPSLNSLWYFNGTNNVSYVGANWVSLAQGSHAFKFYANNSLGEIQNKNVTFFIDSINPTISIISPANNSIFNTSSILVNILSDGDNVWFFNGTFNQSYVAPVWIDFSEGVTKIGAWAEDLAGNLNYTFVNILVDTISPIMSVFSPVQEMYYNESDLLINFTATDVNLDSLWYFNGTSNNNYASPVIRTLYDGDYSFTFYANDSAGHVGLEEVNFTIDTIHPSIDVFSPENKYYNTSNIVVNFTSNDINLDSLWYFDGVANSSYIVPVNKAILDGIYTYDFYANDSAGNFNQTNRTFIIDTLNPILFVHSPIQGMNYLPGFDVLINFTATDINLDSLWYFNGTNNISYVGAYYLNLTNGFYTYDFYANDSAGNTVFEQINFSVLDKRYVRTSARVTKSISTINTNMYLIELDLENNLNITSNDSIVDFVDVDFVDGSYSLFPDDISLFFGSYYNGKIIRWNFSLFSGSQVEVNYSLAGVSDYKLLNNFIVGLD